MTVPLQSGTGHVLTHDALTLDVSHDSLMYIYIYIYVCKRTLTMHLRGRAHVRQASENAQLHVYMHGGTAQHQMLETWLSADAHV